MSENSNFKKIGNNSHHEYFECKCCGSLVKDIDVKNRKKLVDDNLLENK